MKSVWVQRGKILECINDYEIHWKNNQTEIEAILQVCQYSIVSTSHCGF